MTPRKRLDDTPPIHLVGYKHGVIGTYRAGCRCEPCRDIKRASGLRHRANRAAANPTVSTAGGTRVSTAGPIGPANVVVQGDPSWRPRHYPPACPDCAGFGYTPETWSRCRRCRAHPGHAMSFADWDKDRAR